MSVRKRDNYKNEHSIRMNDLLPLHPDTTNSLEEITGAGRFHGDGKNITLLFLLYTLQGIPLGLSAAIPMILQNRGVSYKQQAEFSFVNWPFSLKLLWAPLVDSLYISKLGRRKTWLIPVQYMLGLTMFVLSAVVDSWLGSENSEPNINALTVAFFFLNFLAATQDIAVDGWALTMLQKRNIGHASTCNSTGQTAGYFFGYVFFMALESAEFCNNYLRLEPQSVGLVTLSGFLYFWGIVFLITTTLIAIFKHENNAEEHATQIEMNLNEAYSTLWTILKMPPIRTLALILLTAKIGFAATDAVSGLKLVEGGLPKEKLGFLAVPLIPLQIILVFIISKWTSGPRPMDVYVKAIPPRLLFGFVAMALVWVTPYVIVDGHIPIYFFVIILLIYACHQIFMNCMFVAIMAFFAKISDPSVGGTYMTLLNTLANLGGNWPSTVALWFVDSLTWRNCVGSKENSQILNECSTIPERKECTDAGGTCETQIDGFYLETVICAVIGFIWLLWIGRKINYLQSLNEAHWSVFKNEKQKKKIANHQR
ncbi:acetyl-coenzyme A transporter 1 [Chrysoperla carnea]|uniref:acetyl-coenzyme A transporter 1 n=1 Tax=Chrysoperla carnea TaxID=189513 RepID=UPI001D0955EB|nr:acetyl-coenzyme A transporter 1 [Chrysoperla carnea]